MSCGNLNGEVTIVPIRVKGGLVASPRLLMQKRGVQASVGELNELETQRCYISGDSP